jgi:hypothetical protein
MSLYKFFESFVQSNPDLSKFRVYNSINYDDLYNEYRSDVKYFTKLRKKDLKLNRF